MKLLVGTVFTEVEGDFLEVGLIQSVLTMTDQEGNEKELFRDNRFYSGLLNRVLNILKFKNYEVEVEYTYDKFVFDPAEMDFTDDIVPGMTLRPYQWQSCIKFLLNSRGVVSVSTGGGKTNMAVALAYYLYKKWGIRTIFVNDTDLGMNQAHERFTKFGLECGRFGGGYKELDSPFTSVISDSMLNGIRRRDEDVLAWVKDCNFLVIDECHHLSSNGYLTLASNCPAQFRCGLSASAFEHPTERCYEDLLIVGQLGEIVCHISPRWLIDHKYLAEPLIFWINVPRFNVPSYDWHKVYSNGVVNAVWRNHATVAIARHMASLNFKILILVQRIEHGEILLKMLQDPSVVFSSGGGVTRRWDEIENKIVETVQPNEVTRCEFDSVDGISRILIATTIYDECADLQSMNTLIMTGGGRKWRRTLQRVGRPLHSRDDFVYIFDFVDNQHPFLLKHSKQRQEVYNSLQYQTFSSLNDLNLRISSPLVLESAMLGSSFNA